MLEDNGESAELSDDLLAQLESLRELAAPDGTAALEPIRRFFDQNPDVWKKIGNLAYRAQMAIADLGAGGDGVLKEANLRYAAALAAELAGPAASRLERLLAEHVATCWLKRYETERSADVNVELPVAQAGFLDRRNDRAQRRYEYAIKTLALIRKMERPAPHPIDVATTLQDNEADRRTRSRNGQKSPAATGVPVNN